MTPIISIVGLSGSGKTTLIEKLIPELKGRGYRVASIKHAQEIHFEPGKDSERHMAAGSEAALVAIPGRVFMIKKSGADATLEDISRILGDEYDIVLAEGFKQGEAPKIVLQRANLQLSIDNLSRVAAIVTDQPLPGKLRQFSLEDIKGLADFIEQGFIKPQSERLSLFVNGQAVPLIMFPRQMMTGLLLGMVSSLKGVKKIKNIQICLSTGKENKLHNAG
jgi:molybdopterin-guanine dinucleotide biosynthesis protein B